MKSKVGIDIVKNSRIKLTPDFLQKFLSKNELALINSFTSKKRRKEFAAGRWAVKEAIFKALDNPIALNSIDIGYENNKPVVLNTDLKNVSISISHEKNYSVGIAIII